MSTIEFNEKAA